MRARFLAMMEHVPFAIKCCLRGKKLVMVMLRIFYRCFESVFLKAKAFLDVQGFQTQMNRE